MSNAVYLTPGVLESIFSKYCTRRTSIIINKSRATYDWIQNKLLRNSSDTIQCKSFGLLIIWNYSDGNELN